jgi:hypothetical protein
LDDDDRVGLWRLKVDHLGLLTDVRQVGFESVSAEPLPGQDVHIYRRGLEDAG